MSQAPNLAMKSKLMLLRDRFTDKTREEIVIFDADRDRRGMKYSGGRDNYVWGIIVENGLEMARSMLDVCFDVGKIRDASDAATVVKDEYTGFIRSWGSNTDHLQMMLQSQAMSRLSTVDLEAHSRLADVMAKEPKETRLSKMAKQLDPVAKILGIATGAGAAASAAWHAVASWFGH